MLSRSQWANISFYLVMLVLSIVFIVYALRMPPGIGNIPGPGVFPLLICILIIVLVSMGVYRVLTETKKAKAKGVEGFAVEQPQKEVNFFAVAALVALTFVYAYLIPVFGFFWTTPVYLIAVLILLNVRKWWYVILLSGSFTFIVYALFRYFLKVPFPRGSFWY